MEEIPTKNSGAVQYGNFINYYQFNPAADRFKLLPDNIWLSQEDQFNSKKPYLLLDVGCNTGELTQQCWQHITDNAQDRPVYVLAVDLDEMLILRAQENNKQTENINYVCLNVMNENAFNATVKQFLIKFGQDKFNAISCFSVTMWIHLNDHDSGLQQLLKKLSDITDLLVLEPQPWKCYQSAQRRQHRLQREFPLFLQLQWRSNIEEKIDEFMQIKLQRRRVHKTEKTHWKRSLYFYR